MRRRFSSSGVFVMAARRRSCLGLGDGPVGSRSATVPPLHLGEARTAARNGVISTRVGPEALCHPLGGGAAVAWAEGQQRKVPGAADRRPEPPLVLGAHPGFPSGLDFEPVRKKPLNSSHILVVYVLDVVDAERAQLSPGVVARPAPSGTRSGCHLLPPAI